MECSCIVSNCNPLKETLHIFFCDLPVQVRVGFVCILTAILQSAHLRMGKLMVKPR